MFYRTFHKNSSSYRLRKIFIYWTLIILNEFSEEDVVDFYQLIGENVKKARKEKNISQIQLALAIGHNSVGHIAKAELCKYGKRFNLEQLYKISKILNVPIEVFFKQQD